MDIPSSAGSATEHGIKSEDNASNENNDTSSQDEEIIPPFGMNDEDEEEDDDDDDDDGENFEEEENSDNNDNEEEGEDLLLAMGAGCSEERNDLPGASSNINVSPSKFNQQFLQKSLDSSTGLAGGLDILNLNAQLSKLVAPGSSNGTNGNESTCLFLNNIYQTLLLENLTKVEQQLAENREKQKLLFEKIRRSQKSDYLFAKPRKNVFCIPFFHRKSNEPEPNAHTKILRTWHTDRIIREKAWTNTDHENLLEAIHENVWEMTLKPFLQRLEIYSVKMMTLENEEEKKVYEQKIEDTQLEMEIVQQKDTNEIIDGIDHNKIDWMKISNLTFNGRHSEFSCHLMWKNWLHPRLNKTPWTQKETKKLAKLVELHGRHQWKLIAEELETNRTPFHCLQHYRRKLDAQIKKEWTAEEEKILKEVIDMCRIGKIFPWNQVSFYMEGRSAESCSKRWALLNPALKHGRWTNEEDSLLLAGVNMLGINSWDRVKLLVTGRTAAQCRERWVNSLDPNIKTGTFTYEEDKQLIKLVKEHGTNWALIATMIPGRTDASCRRQFDKLKKWELQTDYVSNQSDESKMFFLKDFNVKYFADLVEKKEKTLDQLFPLVSCRRELEVILKNQPQMLKRDLVLQELDRRKGEVFVPRPQILRKYSNTQLVKMWEGRKNLRKNIEDFIKKQLIKKQNELKGSTMVSSGLEALKPNTSVTEMLKIARCLIITNTHDQNKISHSKKHLCADVDKRIRGLLYIDWLREDMKDQPKLAFNKSKANCQEEKYLDKLEGMALLMTVLGMNRKNIKKKMMQDSSNGPLPSTSYLTSEEMQNFREEFLLVSKDPQTTMNFSRMSSPKVGFSDIVPPNTHTLTAFRLLFLNTPDLQKSADRYHSQRKKTNATSDASNQLLPLSQRVEMVKESVSYQMLRVHFRSLFMWPALLSTLSPPSRLNATKPYSKGKAKKRKYPLSAKIAKGHRKKKQPPPPPTNGSCDSNSEKNEPIPKPCEESNSSDLTTTSLSPTSSVDQTPRKRGRPQGAITKNKKVWDIVPQRTSSRQREKKARLDPELPTSWQTRGTSEQMSDKETQSFSANSTGRETTEVGPDALTMNKDLLANVSSDLVQKVISQEVQVKPMGTYISLPLSVKNNDMPLL